MICSLDGMQLVTFALVWPNEFGGDISLCPFPPLTTWTRTVLKCKNTEASYGHKSLSPKPHLLIYLCYIEIYCNILLSIVGNQTSEDSFHCSVKPEFQWWYSDRLCLMPMQVPFNEYQLHTLIQAMLYLHLYGHECTQESVFFSRCRVCVYACVCSH